MVIFCVFLFFVLLEKGDAYFFNYSSFFRSPLRFFTFTHAHKCTPKTLFITSNKDQRHEHVLIRSSTSFTKACDSAECFGGRESIASFRQSSIGEKRSHLLPKRCSRAASKAERERTTNGNARDEQTDSHPRELRELERLIPDRILCTRFILLKV